MVRAIVVRQQGGPEVYKVENVPDPKAPGPDQVLIRHTALGINFTDIYYRTGLYAPPRMPYIPGVEGVGVIEAVGPNVKIELGTRVAYASVQSGAFCEKRIINKHFLIPIPKEINDETAAAVTLKGMAAHYLLHRTHRVKPGDTILVHAAAGGTGQFICQWAKQIGATVIGTVSTPQKAQIAKQMGCSHTIVYTQDDFVTAVKDLTKGKGVQVVYDGVGKDTFMRSIQALQLYGLLVSYGQSSGAVPPLNVLSLAQKGIFLTRPTLMLYKAHRMELVLSAAEVYERVKKGMLRANIHSRWSLDNLAQAYQNLASRDTTGQLVVTF